jgi:polar amino acid transport system substrate-binding protein
MVGAMLLLAGRSLTFALAIIFFASVASAETLKAAGQVAPPFLLYDKATNTYQGIAYELLQAIAKDAGFEFTYEIIVGPEFVSALVSKKIDLVASNMAINATNKEQVEMTDEYFAGGEGMYVPKSDTKAYEKLEDIKGMPVATLDVPTYISLLQRAGITDLKKYATIDEILEAVATGEAKFAVFSNTIGTYKLKRGEFPEIRKVSSYKATQITVVGFAVRKGETELVGRIQKSLTRFKNDGTLNTILAKYGLPPRN